MILPHITFARHAAPKSRARCSSMAPGFSLLEVLCAVLILGIAMVGLTQGITTALHSSKDSEVQMAAATYAAGLMESLRAEGGLVVGEEEGECGPGLDQFKWKQTIRNTDLDGLREIEVLMLKADSGKIVYELNTWLFEIPDDTRTAQDKRKENRERSRR